MENTLPSYVIRLGYDNVGELGMTFARNCNMRQMKLFNTTTTKTTTKEKMAFFIDT